MARNSKTVAPKNLEHLLQKLAPLGQINGVQDYLLADCLGRVLARKPGSVWEEEIAGACARDVAQVGEILGLFYSPDGEERVFDFRFEGALLIAWDFGSAYLVAVCSEEVDVPMTRLTDIVIKEELRKDKRCRRYLAPRRGGDGGLLTEKELGHEPYKHVAALKQR